MFIDVRKKTDSVDLNVRIGLYLIIILKVPAFPSKVTRPMS